MHRLNNAPVLPVDEIQAWLGANPGVNDATDLRLASEYRTFYGLDFSLDEHRMGWLPVHAERVFVQFYARRENDATVLLLHGYLDHSGILGPTFERLLDLGYNVVALDHVGHGLSTGQRASTDTFQLYVDSVSAAHEAIGATGPWLIMGHSLGGAVAMTHMLQHPHVFKRAVLVAPLFRPGSYRLVQAFRFLGRHFVKGQPRLWRNNTHDAAYRYFIKHVDPLSPRFIPIEWIDAMVEWMRDFRVLDPVEADVLVVQGTDDGTVDWRRNLAMIRRKFPGADVHLVPEGKHQLLNEADEWRERTWASIQPFLMHQRETK